MLELPFTLLMVAYKSSPSTGPESENQFEHSAWFAYTAITVASPASSTFPLVYICLFYLQ